MPLLQVAYWIISLYHAGERKTQRRALHGRIGQRNFSTNRSEGCHGHAVVLPRYIQSYPGDASSCAMVISWRSLWCTKRREVVVLVVIAETLPCAKLKSHASHSHLPSFTATNNAVFHNITSRFLTPLPPTIPQAYRTHSLALNASLSRKRDAPHWKAPPEVSAITSPRQKLLTKHTQFRVDARVPKKRYCI